MCMFGDFIKECIWNHFILAPIRSFFNRGKVKEDVQQGVEVVVNAAEKGLETLDQATSGAVSSLADELSKAGVDLSHFKNSIVEGLEKEAQALTDDVHTVENEVTNTEKKVVNVVANVGQGLKDEFHHVETQTEVKVEKAEEAAKTTFVKTEKMAESALQSAGDVIKNTENSVVETVSSLASELASFGEPSQDKKEIPAEKGESASYLSKGWNAAEETVASGIQNAKEAASATETKVEEGLLGFGEKVMGGISGGVQAVEGSISKTEDTISGWTTSLLTKEKELLSGLTGLKNDAKEAVSNKKDVISSDLQAKSEEVSSAIHAGVKHGEELASAGVETTTQGLSSLRDETSSAVQQVADKVAENADNLKEKAAEKKTEVTSGFSSDLHFLRDTVVASKDIVVESLHFGRQHKDNEEPKEPTSAPEFQSTQKPISSSLDTEEKKPEEQSSSDNTSNSDNKEEEMGDKDEHSPVKEVSDFLKQEISESSKHIDTKEAVKEVEASGSSTEAQVAKHTIFDSFTDISSTITNTLHNIETEIESTGKNILTGVGTKVKEAGDFMVGTEEVDEKMDDAELKTEAVTSLLDKSFLN